MAYITTKRGTDIYTGGGAISIDAGGVCVQIHKSKSLLLVMRKTDADVQVIGVRNISFHWALLNLWCCPST